MMRIQKLPNFFFWCYHLVLIKKVEKKNILQNIFEILEVKVKLITVILVIRIQTCTPELASRSGPGKIGRILVRKEKM